MPNLLPFAALVPVMLAVPSAEPASVGGWMGAQITIRQHIVIRMPSVTMARSGVPLPRMPAPPVWEERKQQKCVALNDLAAATVTRADSVDFILRDGSRVRARLAEACPSLGFYAGLYIKPTGDGKMCARRDSIRSRAGGVCDLAGFYALRQRR